jgi:hypothetical protein
MKTEMEMFIEHAQQTNSYPVLEFYRKSWLPLKAAKLREITQGEPHEEITDSVDSSDSRPGGRHGTG